MNADQITGPIRAILPVLTGYAAARGWIPAGDYSDGVVMVVTGFMAVWSIWSNRTKA